MVGVLAPSHHPHRLHGQRQEQHRGWHRRRRGDQPLGCRSQQAAATPRRRWPYLATIHSWAEGRRRGGGSAETRSPATLRPLPCARRRPEPSLSGTSPQGWFRRPAPCGRRIPPTLIGRGPAHVMAAAAAIGRRARRVSSAAGGGRGVPPWRACTRACTSTR